MSADRVTHFAFVSTGPSCGGWLGPCYWKNNQALFDVLREYGYPNEAIFRLSEAGEWHQPGVGLATLDNFTSVFDHLGRVAQQEDHVFIAIIGHGLHPHQPTNPTGECAHVLLDKCLSATMLADLLKKITAKRVTIALHPCFSGGFLPKLDGAHPDRVIVTSTAADQANAVGWIEMFTAALSLRCRDRGRSIKEVWEETSKGAAIECQRYGRPPEKPQLANAAVAAQRYLGNEGRPLNFSDDALEELRRENAELRLTFRV